MYKPNRWWYEFIILGRRVVLISVTVAMSNHSHRTLMGVVSLLNTGMDCVCVIFVLIKIFLVIMITHFGMEKKRKMNFIF